MNKLILLGLIILLISIINYGNKNNQDDEKRMDIKSHLVVSEYVPKVKDSVKQRVYGWNPQQACDFLEETNYFSTKNHLTYKDLLGDGKYQCSSKEFELPSDSGSIPNDLAYRALGNKDTATVLKLILDLHQPQDESAGIGLGILISDANKLALKATGSKLPDGVSQALLLGKSLEVVVQNFKHSVVRNDYPNGNGGYEIHYVLTNKSAIEKSTQQKSVKRDAQSGIALAKKVYAEYESFEYEFEPLLKYSSPELKKILRDFDKISRKIDPEMGCDQAVHYYLGFGNGGAPENFSKTLKFKLLKDGNIIRATFRDSESNSNKVGADLNISCKSGKCYIDDIRRLDDNSSIKADYLKVIKNKSCG